MPSLVKSFCIAIAFPVIISAQPVTSPTDNKLNSVRATALPRNEVLADQFAKCFSIYFFMVTTLEKHGQSAINERKLADWLWFNAIDLSDNEFATKCLQKHIKEYIDTEKTIWASAKDGTPEQQNEAAGKLQAYLAPYITQANNFYTKYKDKFNIVTQNPDGTYQITKQ